MSDKGPHVEVVGRLAKDCPICVAAGSVYSDYVAFQKIMNAHPRCQACNILRGPGHLEQGLEGDYCWTHARPGFMHHGGRGRVQVREVKESDVD